MAKVNMKLIEQIKNAHKNKGNRNTVTYNGSYELVQTAVGYYSQLDPVKIGKIDLEVLYQLGRLKFGKDARDRWINRCNLPESHKRGLLDINQKWADRGDCWYAERNGHCGLFVASTARLPRVTDEGAKILIKMLVKVSKFPDSNADKMFAIVKADVKEALLCKISGVQAAVISQILHLLKPDVFPILNSRGQSLYEEELGLNGLNKVNKIDTFADNAKLIYDFREQYLKDVNFRTIDSFHFDP